MNEGTVDVELTGQSEKLQSLLAVDHELDALQKRDNDRKTRIDFSKKTQLLQCIENNDEKSSQQSEEEMFDMTQMASDPTNGNIGIVDHLASNKLHEDESISDSLPVCMPPTVEEPRVISSSPTPMNEMIPMNVTANSTEKLSPYIDNGENVNNDNVNVNVNRM